MSANYESLLEKVTDLTRRTTRQAVTGSILLVRNRTLCYFSVSVKFLHSHATQTTWYIFSESRTDQLFMDPIKLRIYNRIPLACSLKYSQMSCVLPSPVKDRNHAIFKFNVIINGGVWYLNMFSKHAYKI